MDEITHAGSAPRDGDVVYQEKLARAMRLALKRVADYAMQHDDPAAAANGALALLHAAFIWRFELLRSPKRQPVLIVPEPLPAPGAVSQSAG